MAFVNIVDKLIQVKIVYYGPGRSGKTTNLEYIFNNSKGHIQSDMVNIETHGDRTLYFDYLPFDMGKIKGYDIKIQLYTVPGQVKYNATRKLVLNGVDGIVFVADAMAVQRENNRASLVNLQHNLNDQDKNIFKMPLVLQYNKRDLENLGVPVLSLETMERDLNTRLRVPSIGASAINGKNVLVALKKIISVTLQSLNQKIN